MTKQLSKSFRPSIESLEDRRLMTATLFRDVVTIEGTPNADQVVVSVELGASIQRQRSGFVLPLSEVVVRENGVVTGRFPASQVRLVEFYGFAGNDCFKNKTAIRAYAEGGAGNDKLIGGAVTDEFYGGADNDILKGKGGVDYLFGEAGRDRLDGGKDGLADELYGGRDADTFVAEPFGVALFLNRDAPLDFNAQEGDTIDYGLVLTRR